MATEDSGNDAAGLVETRMDPNSDAAARTTAAGTGEGRVPQQPDGEIRLGDVVHLVLSTSHKADECFASTTYMGVALEEIMVQSSTADLRRILQTISDSRREEPGAEAVTTNMIRSRRFIK